MNFDLVDVLEVLNIQRTHAIDYASDCGVAVHPDVLWIPHSDDFDTSANRQVSYYNGHVNMIESILIQGNQKMHLHVRNNNHYVSEEDEHTVSKRRLLREE